MLKKEENKPLKEASMIEKKYYPNFATEFAHFERDTIVGKDHKSCVITIIEKESKAIVTLKPENSTSKSIEERLDKWLEQIPIKLVKSITFDCGKEFSN